MHVSRSACSPSSRPHRGSAPPVRNHGSDGHRRLCPHQDPATAHAVLVARPQSEQRLDDALSQARPVLLSAPAGFGARPASRWLSLRAWTSGMPWPGSPPTNTTIWPLRLVAALEPFDPTPARGACGAPGRLCRRPRAAAVAVFRVAQRSRRDRGRTRADRHRRRAPRRRCTGLRIDALIERLPPHDRCSWRTAWTRRWRWRAARARRVARVPPSALRGGEVQALLQEAGAQGAVSAQLLLERTQGSGPRVCACRSARRAGRRRRTRHAAPCRRVPGQRGAGRHAALSCAAFC